MACQMETKGRGLGVAVYLMRTMAPLLGRSETENVVVSPDVCSVSGSSVVLDAAFIASICAFDG